MTFAEILRKADMEEAKRIILKFDARQKRSLAGYDEVYNTLLGLEPKSVSAVITIEHIALQDESDCGYEHVSGVDTSDGQHYSLSLTPWAEWLGMEVSVETISNYGINEIVAYCLYDMTFYGFDEEQIQAFGDMMNEDVENIDPREYYTFENGKLVKKYVEDDDDEEEDCN